MTTLISRLPILVALAWVTASPAIAQTPTDAQKGRNGWLIYTGPGGNLEDFIHSNTLSDAQLTVLSRKVEEVDVGFRRRGTTFLWIAVPNTPTIYPESMPARYRPVAPQSRLAQMDAAFAAKGLTSFVDTTPVILKAKTATGANLYRKTDTHWTDLGAFAAYRETMRRMAVAHPEWRKQLTPVDVDAYAIVIQKGFSGDLAGMLGLKGDLTEDLPVLVAKSPRSAAISDNVLKAVRDGTGFEPAPAPGFSIELKRPGVVATGNSARCPGPSLVMYHDSFGFVLAQWMAEHFCSATFSYAAHHTKTASVDREWHSRNAPTFVVLESVERFAMHEFTTSALDEFVLANVVAADSIHTR